MLDENQDDENLRRDGSDSLLPPKIFDQLPEELLAPPPEDHPDALLAAETTPSSFRADNLPGEEQPGALDAEPQLAAAPGKKKSWFLVLLALIVVATAAVFLHGPTRNRLFGEPSDAQKTSATQLPPDVQLKPSVAVPLPTESEYTAAGLSGTLDDLLGQMDRYFRSDIARGDMGLRPYISIAGLGLYNPLFGLTESDLKDVSPAEAEVLRIYQAMLNHFGNTLGHDGNRKTDLDALEAEYSRLSALFGERAKMPEISKIVVCRDVGGFGIYDPFTSNQFSRRAMPLIQVYSELTHFTPQLEDTRYVIRFSEELALLNAADDSEVWKQHPVMSTDTSRSRKRDFYLAHYLRIPRSVEAGKYKVRVTITDQTTGAKAVGVTPIVITDE
ncbi:MAG TPA: hypothetical protein PLE77_03275 [Kiritimatiellia bacterium]|nr:hypothetical protein [Kiritimatiellia bacterium]